MVVSHGLPDSRIVIWLGCAFANFGWRRRCRRAKAARLASRPSPCRMAPATPGAASLSRTPPVFTSIGADVTAGIGLAATGRTSTWPVTTERVAMYGAGAGMGFVPSAAPEAA